jgi:hypothetical protein
MRWIGHVTKIVQTMHKEFYSAKRRLKNQEGNEGTGGLNLSS